MNKLTLICLIAAFLCFYSINAQSCTAEDKSMVNTDVCNDNGYCVGDDDMFACSCISGVAGENCDQECSCTGKVVTGDSSLFRTTIGGSYEDGNIQLDLTVDVEQNIHDTTGDSYSTWTEFYFRNQNACDYPEGDGWSKTFEEDGVCTETYTLDVPVVDLVECIEFEEETVCIDNAGEELDSCDSSNCDNPPCYKCFAGQVQAERGYRRTSESGRIYTDATAENCHYFDVCLPWILNVEDTVEVTHIPEVDNDIVVRRVAFRCFDAEVSCYDENYWIIEVLSLVEYPFFIEEVDPEQNLGDTYLGSGRLVGERGDDTVIIDLSNDDGIVELEGDDYGCGVEGKFCAQVLSFNIEGCDSLEEAINFAVEGLQYNCVGDCADALEASDDDYSVIADIVLQATQDQCGADLDITVDADFISLDMETFLNDWETPNSVFLADEDSDLNTVYFIVTASSNVDIDSISLVNLERDPDFTGDVSYQNEDCPASLVDDDDDDVHVAYVCFSAGVEDIDFSDSENTLIDVAFEADIEINYFDTGDKKRTIGLKNSHSLNKVVNVFPSGSSDDSSSVINAIAAMLMFLALAF